jgi:hypothetical protein
LVVLAIANAEVGLMAVPAASTPAALAHDPSGETTAADSPITSRPDTHPSSMACKDETVVSGRAASFGSSHADGDDGDATGVAIGAGVAVGAEVGVATAVPHAARLPASASKANDRTIRDHEREKQPNHQGATTAVATTPAATLTSAPAAGGDTCKFLSASDAAALVANPGPVKVAVVDSPISKVTSCTWGSVAIGHIFLVANEFKSSAPLSDIKAAMVSSITEAGPQGSLPRVDRRGARRPRQG